MTRSSFIPESPASKTSFDSSHSERGRTRTRDSTYTVRSDTIPTISEPTPGTSRKSSNHMNVYTTCGRHTDQFLFGGPSLGEMARSLFSRSRSRRAEERER